MIGRTFHALEQTAVHALESAGSAADRTSNGLAKEVDTPGGEEPAPQNMTKGYAGWRRRLTCTRLYDAPPGGSIPRSIRPYARITPATAHTSRPAPIRRYALLNRGTARLGQVRRRADQPHHGPGASGVGDRGEVLGQGERQQRPRAGPSGQRGWQGGAWRTSRSGRPGSSRDEAVGGRPMG